MTIGRKEKKKIRNLEEKKNGENMYYFYYTTSFLYLYETTKEKLTVLANSTQFVGKIKNSNDVYNLQNPQGRPVRPN